MGKLKLRSDHRLVCGDCTVPETVDAALGGAKPDLMVTDPPYGIGYEYTDHDDADSQANLLLIERAFGLCASGKVWTPGLMNLARDISRFGKAKVLCWNKKFAAAGNGLGGASTWEPILVCGELPRKSLNNDVLEFPTDRQTVGGKNLRDLHSCPKPVGLYQFLIEAFSMPGNIVYEPFCGSGTTLIACEKSWRRCRATEISPAYTDVIIIRWQEYTGKTAVHAETGLTFAQTAAQRLGKGAA